MRRVLIAPDAFKESLSALAAARAMRRGVLRAEPRARCVLHPVADGGEGTAAVLLRANGGRWRRLRVTGPAGAPVTARYAELADGVTAVIELAAASGLPLLPAAQRDPLHTTTWGTGELVLDAVRRGRRRIVLGLGGSATVDGGLGMLQALGVRLLDARGRALAEPATGSSLARLARLDPSGLQPALAQAHVEVACDVSNPLTGPRGAAVVFGPQKGADRAAVRQLEAGLRHLARVLRRDTGVAVARLSGGGAAGGAAAALHAVLRAPLRPGARLVLARTRFGDALDGADLVLTGEGRLDAQTAAGKAPAAVARAARRRRLPVVAIGGAIDAGARGRLSALFDAVEAAVVAPVTSAQALEQASGLLASAAERVMRQIAVGERLARRHARR